MKPRLAATGRYLMLLGAGCLIIVVLTHVCQTFHLFPLMGCWTMRSRFIGFNRSLAGAWGRVSPAIGNGKKFD
jgi:hypothetical protein